MLPGGQLGGTQGGIRLLRRLDSQGALAASLRLSTPSKGIGREMAVGIDWRPLRHVPIHLLVEQRLALDAGRRLVPLNSKPSFAQLETWINQLDEAVA